MSRYYDDTVACMGALQIVPVFAQSRVFLLIDNSFDFLLNLGSFVHSIITKKGHALNVLFERLHRAADSNHDGWKEDAVLKSVFLTSTSVTIFKTLTRYLKDDIVRQYDQSLSRLELLDP